MNIFILILLLFTSLGIWAEEAEAPTATYVKISDNLVVNYGEPSSGRLKYLKVAVDVRVASTADIGIVHLHLPALQDSLIFLLSAQNETSVRTREGKEDIRMAALSEFQRIIEIETGMPVIEDLLFGAFIVQR